MTAAAQGDRGLVFVDREGIAGCITNRHRSVHQQRAIVASTNRHVGHRSSLLGKFAKVKLIRVSVANGRRTVSGPLAGLQSVASGIRRWQALGPPCYDTERVALQFP